MSGGLGPRHPCFRRCVRCVVECGVRSARPRGRLEADCACVALGARRMSGGAVRTSPVSGCPWAAIAGPRGDERGRTERSSTGRVSVPPRPSLPLNAIAGGRCHTSTRWTRRMVRHDSRSVQPRSESPTGWAPDSVAPNWMVRVSSDPSTECVSRKPANAEHAASDGLSSPEVALRRFKRHCRAFATRMGEEDFFSHGTALILRGSPTPAAWDRVIHVSGIRPRNPARTTGVISHRLAVRAPAYREVGGLRIEDPARAWVQASAHLTDVELIIAADHLVARRRRPQRSTTPCGGPLAPQASTRAAPRPGARGLGVTRRDRSASAVSSARGLPEPALGAQCLRSPTGGLSRGSTRRTQSFGSVSSTTAASMPKTCISSPVTPTAGVRSMRPGGAS